MHGHVKPLNKGRHAAKQNTMTTATLQSADDGLHNVRVSDGGVQLVLSYVVYDDIGNQVANTFTTPHGRSA